MVELLFTRSKWPKSSQDSSCSSLCGLQASMTLPPHRRDKGLGLDRGIYLHEVRLHVRPAVSWSLYCRPWPGACASPLMLAHTSKLDQHTGASPWPSRGSLSRAVRANRKLESIVDPLRSASWSTRRCVTELFWGCTTHALSRSSVCYFNYYSFSSFDYNFRDPSLRFEEKLILVSLDLDF